MKWHRFWLANHHHETAWKEIPKYCDSWPFEWFGFIRSNFSKQLTTNNDFTILFRKSFSFDHHCRCIKFQIPQARYLFVIFHLCCLSFWYFVQRQSRESVLISYTLLILFLSQRAHNRSNRAWDFVIKFPITFSAPVSTLVAHLGLSHIALILAHRRL